MLKTGFRNIRREIWGKGSFKFSMILLFLRLLGMRTMVFLILWQLYQGARLHKNEAPSLTEPQTVEEPALKNALRSSTLKNRFFGDMRNEKTPYSWISREPPAGRNHICRKKTFFGNLKAPSLTEPGRFYCSSVCLAGCRSKRIFLTGNCSRTCYCTCYCTRYCTGYCIDYYIGCCIGNCMGNSYICRR